MTRVAAAVLLLSLARLPAAADPVDIANGWRGNGTGVWRDAALPQADRGAGWRGDGTGIFPEAKPPLSWTGPAASPFRWKTEVGGGMSSPVVAGDRVFVTAEPDVLVCVDRESGNVLWKQSTRFDHLSKEEGVKPEKSARVPDFYSSPTLAGSLLFVGHDGGGSVWLKTGRAYVEAARNLLPEGAAGSFSAEALTSTASAGISGHFRTSPATGVEPRHPRGLPHRDGDDLVGGRVKKPAAAYFSGGVDSPMQIRCSRVRR